MAARGRDKARLSSTMCPRMCCWVGVVSTNAWNCHNSFTGWPLQRIKGSDEAKFICQCFLKKKCFFLEKIIPLWSAVEPPRNEKNPQTIQLLDMPQHLASESISDQMSWLTDFRGSAYYKLTAVLRKFEKLFSRWVGLPGFLRSCQTQRRPDQTRSKKEKKRKALSSIVLYSLLYIQQLLAGSWSILVRL